MMRISGVLLLGALVQLGCHATSQPATTARAPVPEAPPRAAPPESPVAGEGAATPRLLPGDAPEGAIVRQRLTDVQSLLALLDTRRLTDGQREQAQMVRAFSAQATEALDDADLRRAAILSEKAFLLVQDVEAASRE